MQGFIDNLRTLPAGDHVIHGMVKPAEQPDGLMFANVGDCDHWVFIPASAIQSVRDTGQTVCLGHSHTTADIQLKDPQSDLEKAFSNVAGLHQAQLSKALAAPRARLAANPCPPGFELKRDQWGNLSCQPAP